MKAVVQERYGSVDALKLGEVAAPAAGDEEVLVRVRAASVHPDIWHTVTGRPYVLRLMGGGLRRPKKPIPGTDMAGVVHSAGKGVTRFGPGDAVFGMTSDANEWTNGGAYAEYVAVAQDLLAPKPANVSFEQAAAVPTSGFITLLNLPALSAIRPGHRVLVNGAGGGVGALALQVVKACGAYVTAVDSTAKLAMLRELGADEVIDYTQQDFTRLGKRYDLIFDVPGNHSFFACRRALEPEGRYVIIGHEGFGASGNRVFGLIPRFLGLMFLSRFLKQLGRGSSVLPTRKDALDVLAQLLADGKVTPRIDSTYPLGEARAALRHMIEDELHGKVILTT